MKLTKAKIQQHIAKIREGANVFLIDTARLKRRSGVEYVNGEARTIYSDPEVFACRLITRSGSESNNIAAQPREIQQTAFTGLYRMQIPYDLNVNEGDHVLYTDAYSGEEVELDVVFSPAKHIYSAAVIIQLQVLK